MFDALICPISNARIDRNVVRASGLITTALLVSYLLTGLPWLIVLVVLDYAPRTMMRGPTSPLTHLARVVAKALGFPYRAMDKAPKVFASRIGVCFAMGAAITHFLAPAVAPWLAGSLAVFTALEAVFDFCFGCVVYTYVALPLYRGRAAAKSIPRSGNLEEPMLASVAEELRSVELPAGARNLTEGSPGAEMFVIRSAEVEAFRDATDGYHTTLATHQPREHFGEMALLTGKARNTSVREVTPVSLPRLQGADLDAFFQRFPGMRAPLEDSATERLAVEAWSKPL